ncbi:MAG: hypothetical protein HC933_06135, partial [Pleurocapsa sp. SU_196_0]|nr:hypothetical protein [Pleurocapsa sp. SU_196_0]
MTFPNLASQVALLQGELRPAENIIAKSGLQTPIAVRLAVNPPNTSAPRAAPSLELRDVSPGRYTLFIEGLDVASGVALYEGVQSLEVKNGVRANTVAKGATPENTPTVQAVRLQRALGSLRAVAPTAPEENLSYVARIGVFTAQMKPSESGLLGVLSSVPTGRDQSLLLEARDAAGNLRFQTRQRVTVHNREQAVTLGNWQSIRVDNAAPHIVVLEGGFESERNAPYRLSLQIDAQGASLLEQVEIHWGDGTSQMVALGGTSSVLNLEHAYGTVGAQTITITAVSRSGTVAQTAQVVQVNSSDATLEATRSLVTLEVGNVPLNASAVYARFIPKPSRTADVPRPRPSSHARCCWQNRRTSSLVDDDTPRARPCLDVGVERRPVPGSGG